MTRWIIPLLNVATAIALVCIGGCDKHDAKPAVGRKSISLELTPDEQKAAKADDDMMEVVKRLNAGQRAEKLPEGAIPITELESACISGQTWRVKRALKGGASANEKSALFGTVLHAAASNGKIEIVRLLVDQGADP